MPKFEQKIELLTRLGLTSNQAIILVTLEKIGEPATVNTISKMSGVTREKIYCVIPKLLEFALVEKILDSPIKFNAVSLKKATSILLRKIEEETSEIKNVTKVLLENPDEEDLEQNCDDETIVVCNKEVGYTKRMHEFEKATQQLDIMTVGFDLELAWSYFLKKYLKILKRGAKIRLILQEHIKSEKILKELKILKENPLFDFRYAKSVSPAMSLYVIDGKQVTIATSIKNFPRNYSVICTRTPVLVALTLGYFENLWKKSTSPNIKTEIAKENLVQ